MRILIYKRTHSGDPDLQGCFGSQDCMGSVRGFDFDAVIGVGGIGGEARAHKLDGKINWIGIGPHKHQVQGKRGPDVTFEHFLDYGTRGPSFRAVAPILADRIYRKNIRRLLQGLTTTEQAEAMKIVRRAANSPASGRRLPSRFQVRVCGVC